MWNCQRGPAEAKPRAIEKQGHRLIVTGRIRVRVEGNLENAPVAPKFLGTLVGGLTALNGHDRPAHRYGAMTVRLKLTRECDFATCFIFRAFVALDRREGEWQIVSTWLVCLTPDSAVEHSALCARCPALASVGLGAQACRRHACATQLEGRVTSARDARVGKRPLDRDCRRQVLGPRARQSEGCAQNQRRGTPFRRGRAFADATA
jgi:hypothetical protein